MNRRSLVSSFAGSLASQGLLRIAALLATLAVSTISGSASAQSTSSRGTLECVAPPSVEAPIISGDLLDPRFKGLALDDLAKVDRKTFPEYEMLIGQAVMVDGVIRQKGALELNEILSASIVSIELDHWVVDVLGRHPRFKDTDDKRHKHGRVGLMRVLVPVGHADGVSDALAPSVLFEKDYADMSLRVEVSVADWVAVIEDRALGFKRLMPLGGGGIDRGVRVKHVTTSLTPTTEDGLLEKTYAYRELNNPWYFKKKPYLPISVAFTYNRPDGTVHKFYKESNIAFHIWQAKGFERGFFSRGCMRMRTEDLMEMAAFVFGASKPIPIAVRMPQRKDVHHPFPMAEHYYEMVNFGTADKPRYQLEWGQLYKTAPGTTPLPRPEELIPLDFRERVVKPVSTEESTSVRP